MSKITTYDFIKANSEKTIILMAMFPITLIFIVYVVIFLFSLMSVQTHNNSNFDLIFYYTNQIAVVILPVVSFIAILWVLISYFAGHNFILSMTNATELNRTNAAEIVRIVENIAIAAGIPTPNVYAINDNGLNAFATGRDVNHSYIALTKGIINKLEKVELECVVAHEMAHIKNRDIRLMLIAIVCISFGTIAAEFLLRTAWMTRSNNNSKNSGSIKILLFALAFAFYAYAYLIAPLIKFAVSRTREFQADATAALITRNPQGLISALKKISESSVVEKLKNNETVAAICIYSPLTKKPSFLSKISGLYSTHPPIEERIKALQIMDGYREVLK
ncbi:MAG: M48 family metallopeptidase [Elusimicrobiota bacterium]|jgi:heat shock protein HtpX|nr:M48 family metallopeptidase [Elusimicrobiota bacterium]